MRIISIYTATKVLY